MKNVIITILAILVLGLGGYLVYDKVIDKDIDNDNNITENNQTQNKEEDYDLRESKKLIDNYYAYMGLEGSPFTIGYTEDMMRYIASRNVALKDVSMRSAYNIYDKLYTSLSGNDKYYEIKSDSGADLGAAYGDLQIISYDAFSETYKKLFGNDKILAKEDISFTYMVYDYDAVEDRFIKLSCECGGADERFEIYGIQNAKIINNKLIINVGSALFESYPEDEIYTTTVAGQKLEFNKNEISKNSETFEQQFLNKYLDQMDTYQFTFFKEDGIYKLEKMSKI